MSLNLLPFLQAIKQAEAPPSYVYNEKLDRYQNEKTGRLVSMKTVYKLLDGNEAVTSGVLDKLSQALHQKKISLPAWTLAVQQQLSRLHVQNATLGAGGFDSLKPKDFARLDAALRADWPRITAFGQDIVAGKLSDKQISGRVIMYAGHARLQFYAAKPKPFIKQGQVVVERRVLRAGDNCAWCVYLAGLGWQPHGTLPLPGESGQQWEKSQCLTNCRCDMEYKVIKRSEANILVKPLASFFGSEYSYRNIIKGGPGSGNHGHDGIPGQQGGSKPTGIDDEHDKPSKKRLLDGMKKPGQIEAPGDSAPKFDRTPEFKDHPISNIFMGDEKIYSKNKAVFTFQKTHQHKEDVVNDLATAINANKGSTNDFIGAWAESSNDTNMTSLATQEAAAELFGTPLTDWQATQLKKAKKKRTALLRKHYKWHIEGGRTPTQALEDMSLRGFSKESFPYPFEYEPRLEITQKIADGFTISSEAEALAWFDKTAEAGKAKAKEALSHIYEQTQAAFKAEGVTHILAHRATTIPDALAETLNADDTLRHTTNALSSWSVSKGVVQEKFLISTPEERAAKQTIVGLTSVIPVSRIVSTPVTGFGCLDEWEVVLMGSGEVDESVVYAIRGIKNSYSYKSIIKGGPGSGNHNHDGIPGHQGGSKPTGRGDLVESTTKPKSGKRASFKVPTGTDSPVDDVLSAGRYDHPYLEMYLGEKGLKEDRETRRLIDKISGQRKNEIVTRLSEGTDLTYDEANSFIKQWAISSNDHNMASLAIQDIAADEFGTALTPWQQMNLTKLDAKRRSAIQQALDANADEDRFMAKYAAGDLRDAITMDRDEIALPFEKAALDQFVSEARSGNGPSTLSAMKSRMDEIEKECRDKTRRALRFTYDETQRKLAAEGIKEIHLYRGSLMDAETVAGMKMGKEIRVQSNALSSWSFSRGVADFFSNGHMGDSEDGQAVVLDAVIPASRIYATAVTGQGCLREWEMITIGTGNDKVRVYSIDGEKIERSFKGGPGSGNHGHAGIPGYQGGSKPTGDNHVEDSTNKQKARFGIPTAKKSAVDDALIDYSYEHPLLEMYVGKRDKSQDEAKWISRMAKQRKSEVAARLMDAGLSESEANSFLRQWAYSSNDHELRSLHVQQTASELFGVPLSQWQQDNLNQTLEVRGLIIKRSLEGLDDAGFDPVAVTGSYYNAVANGHPSISYLNEHKMIESFMDEISASPDRSIYTKAILLKRFAEIEQAAKDKTKQAMAFTYNETQRRLAAEGITELHLFRGSALTRDDTFGMIVGDPINVQMNALSSWSLSSGVADDFTEGDSISFDAPHPGHRVIFDAVVPASRIFSLPVTGPGCLSEWEVVVIGDASDGVRVYRIDKDRVKAFIKGGEGSGNHGHQGIPGHQGGSKPTGRDSAEPSTNQSLVDRMTGGARSASASKSTLSPFSIPTTNDTPVDDAIEAMAYEDNKLLTLLAGKPDKTGEVEDWLEQVSTQKKAEAIAKLSKRAGITEAEANEFIKQWALSSNGDGLASLKIQEAAAQEFGTKLTPWQTENLNNFKRKRRAAIDKILEDMPASGTGFNPTTAADQIEKSLLTEHNSVALPMERSAMDGLFRATRNEQWDRYERAKKGEKGPNAEVMDKAQFIAFFNNRDEESMGKVRRALRATYEETQQTLKDAGIAEVHLYRGAALAANAIAPNATGKAIRVDSNALSSWSFSHQIADEFSGNRDDAMNSVVIDAVVPASRIYSMAGTGPGCLNEWEMVVIGGSGDQVRVLKNTRGSYTAIPSWADDDDDDDEYKAAIIKGGSGSGNHGHDGIPGHQGGSKPNGKLQMAGKEGAGTPTPFAATPEFAEHPLMKMFGGDNPQFLSDGTFRVPIDVQIKYMRENDSELAEHLGVSRAEASEFITTWAESSNDTDLRALGAQEAAAEFFGVPLTDWQREQLDRSLELRMDFIKGNYSTRDMDNRTHGQTVRSIARSLPMQLRFPFESAALEKLGDDIAAGMTVESRGAALDLFNAAEKVGKEKAKKAFAFMYERTQAEFKAAGITHVTAFRGTKLPASQLDGLKAGDTLTYSMNALSSWSLNRNVVDDVFMTFRHHSVTPVGLKNVVPVERIFSIPKTGMGSLPEWEIILLGSNEPDTSEIYKINRGEDEDDE